MFTHTGPRRGDVFAESSFAKQIALIESGQIKPTIKTGNLNSLRTFADVRDAVDAYYKLVTINPIPGEFYNIGGNFSCTIGEMLNTLIGYSTLKNIKIVTDKSRLSQLMQTCKFLIQINSKSILDGSLNILSKIL